MNNLNLAVKLIRLYHNYSQSELADLAGTSPSYISEVESGRSKMSLDLFTKIAMAFNLPGSVIMEFAERLSYCGDLDNGSTLALLATREYTDILAKRGLIERVCCANSKGDLE